MENQNQNRPVENGEKNTRSGENGGKSNRNRHHHGRNRHRGKGGPRPENVGEQAVKVTAEPQTNGNDAPREQKNNKDNNKEREKAQVDRQKGNNGGRDKKHNDRGGNGNNRHGKKRNGYSGEKRPYDPYEEPIAEELSLEELRARIVVKSADAEPAPAEAAPTLEEPTEVSPVEEFEEITLTSPDVDQEITPDITADDLTAEAPEVDNRPRVEIIGIRFRSSGKMYYFDPHGISAKKGDHAIVETARGPEFGDVCLGNTMVCEADVVSPLRPILRLATPADVAHNEDNRIKEQQALEICREKVAAHKLEMKLIDVQYAFDNSKLLFYFTADGRVDFRELVKDLASVFRTRIELRQIGIRDEAKLLGGLGACGRPLCCSTFLPDFAQVSIKMAKEQNLSLNSSKISGVCGRLMCCLRFEADVYAEESKLTPAVDSWVKTEDGVGTVISTNPLAGTVRVILKDSPDTPPKQFHRNEVTVLERRRREAPASEESGEKKASNDRKKTEN